MTNTRRLSTIAILSALSFVLMYFDFPLLPAAPFLRIEFSILPVLVGLIVLDLPAAFVIILLRSLLKLIFKQSRGQHLYRFADEYCGFRSFCSCIWFDLEKDRTPIRFALASLAGTIGLTLAMLVLNYVYAVPLYSKFANFDIEKILGLSNYLLTMVLPFNLIEGIIFALAFWLIYVFLKVTLKRYERINKHI